MLSHSYLCVSAVVTAVVLTSTILKNLAGPEFTRAERGVITGLAVGIAAVVVGAAVATITN